MTPLNTYAICISVTKPLPNWVPKIKEFIEDGVYFDTFTVGQNQRMQEGHSVDYMTINYDGNPTPIILEEYADMPIPPDLAHHNFMVKADRSPKTREMILKPLKQSKACYVFRVNQDSLSEDAWGMMDSVEMYLARQNKGILFTEEGDFYDPDQNLKWIANLLQSFEEQ